MKNSSKIIAAMVVAALLLPGAMAMAKKRSAGNSASRATVEKTYKLGNYRGVDASVGIKVVFTQGDASHVAKVRTTENGAKALIVEIDDGVLTLGYDSRKLPSQTVYGPTTVWLQAPELRSVDLSSGASLTVEGGLTSKNSMKVDMSSGSKASLQTVNVKTLDVDISSGATLGIDNVKADKVEVSSSSGSKVNFMAVVSPTLDIETSSASNVSVTAFRGTKLDIDSSSTSSVGVSRAEATTVNLDASSVAKIGVNGLKATTVNADATSNSRIKVTGNASSWNRDTGSGGKVTFNNNSSDTSKTKPSTPSKRSRSTNSTNGGVPTQAP